MNEKLISVSLVTLFSINQVFAADGADTVELNLEYCLNGNENLGVDYKEEKNEILINKIKFKGQSDKTITLKIQGEINKKQVRLGENAFKGEDNKNNYDNQPPSANIEFIENNRKRVIFPKNSSCLFENANRIKSITGKVDTSNVTNMSSMFEKCKDLQKLDLSNFNTKKVENMKRMFYGCENLQELDLSKFNTNSVTTMESMFFKCIKLQKLDVSNFNTNAVMYMNSMFEECSRLSELNLSSFTITFPSQSLNKRFNNMFRGCTNLKSLVVNKNSFNEDILKKLPKEVKIIDSSENKQNKEENLENALHSKRNELNQIYWRIVANNAIVNADPKGKHAWIKDKKEYGESIMKVIGKAIGDCVTGENEFANPTEDGLIVFKASPEDYKEEHWNAVFLYNYINLLMGDESNAADMTDNNLLNSIRDKLIKHYAYYLPESAIAEKIHNAILDIAEYSEALGLRGILKEYKSKRDDYNQNPQKNNLVPYFFVDQDDYGFDKEISIKNDESEESHKRFLLINCKNGKLCITQIVPDTSDEFSTSIENINYNQYETEADRDYNYIQPEAKRDCNYIQKLLDGLAEVSNMN